MSTRFGSFVGGAGWRFMPECANRRARSEPISCDRRDIFVDGSVGALVGLLVTGDDAEHTWWFRKSGTTEV